MTPKQDPVANLKLFFGLPSFILITLLQNPTKYARVLSVLARYNTLLAKIVVINFPFGEEWLKHLISEKVTNVQDIEDEATRCFRILEDKAELQGIIPLYFSRSGRHLRRGRDGFIVHLDGSPCQGEQQIIRKDGSVIGFEDDKIVILEKVEVPALDEPPADLEKELQMRIKEFERYLKSLGKEPKKSEAGYFADYFMAGTEDGGVNRVKPRKGLFEDGFGLHHTKRVWDNMGKPVYARIDGRVAPNFDEDALSEEQLQFALDKLKESDEDLAKLNHIKAVEEKKKTNRLARAKILREQERAPTVKHQRPTQVLTDKELPKGEETEEVSIPKEDNSTSRGHPRPAQARIEQVQARIKESEDQLAAFRRRAMAKVKELEGLLKISKAHAESLKERVDQLEGQLEEKEEFVLQTAEDLRLAHSTIGDLQQQLSDEATKLAEAEVLKTEALASYSSLEEEINSLRDITKDIDRLLEIVEQALVQREAEIKAFEEELEEALNSPLIRDIKAYLEKLEEK